MYALVFIDGYSPVWIWEIIVKFELDCVWVKAFYTYIKLMTQN
jgi:hypothetical protein